MSRLRHLSEALLNTIVAAGIVWFVFSVQRELAVLNDHLATIEAKMPDPNKPSIVSVPGMAVLADALKPCKEKHK